MTTIRYVNALAASGKTYAAAKIFAESAERGRKVLFVQPTKKLIAETVDHTFKAQGVDPTMVTEFSERTCPNGGIVKAIIAHMSKSAPGRGEIVIITQAAFMLLAQLFKGSQRGDWTLLIDEALSPSTCRALHFWAGRRWRTIEAKSPAPNGSAASLKS